MEKLSVTQTMTTHVASEGGDQRRRGGAPHGGARAREGRVKSNVREELKPNTDPAGIATRRTTHTNTQTQQAHWPFTNSKPNSNTKQSKAKHIDASRGRPDVRESDDGEIVRNNPQQTTQQPLQRSPATGGLNWCYRKKPQPRRGVKKHVTERQRGRERGREGPARVSPPR